MSTLLVISSAPVQEEADGLLLDAKFLAGMTSYCEGWDGEVRCILQKTGGRVPFGITRRRGDLPFALDVVDPGTVLGRAHLEGVDVVLCSGDNHRYFHLGELCRDLPVRLFYIIEYILETRLQIIRLGPERNPLRQAWAAAWTLAQERRRRRAFALADGLQANGYPAAAAYAPLNANTLRYLDNRSGASELATPVQMAARQAHLSGTGPLRLIHSGRLARMKGSQDLVPVARRLRDLGVDFRLDIFGGGVLEEEIRRGIGEAGLQDRVQMHGTVDFRTELVPFTCTQSDIYLSCHRQSDPSCTYLEAMGCGVAVAGYSNRMWQALQQASGAGWVAPLGNAAALAEAIAAAAKNRPELARRCVAARDFAGDHTFETEFGRRIAHLAGRREEAGSAAA